MNALIGAGTVLLFVHLDFRVVASQESRPTPTVCSPRPGGDLGLLTLGTGTVFRKRKGGVSYATITTVAYKSEEKKECLSD